MRPSSVSMPTTPCSRHARRRRLAAAITTAAVTAALTMGLAGPARAIYKGSGTDPIAFQFTARIVSYFPDGTVRKCTGSLFLNNTVVTAAHCVQDSRGLKANLSQATFFYGIPGTQLSIVVKSIVPHDKYDFQSHVNDIAVLFLAQRVTTIKPIALDAATPPVGAKVVHAGYGCTEDPTQTKQCTESKTLRGMSDRIAADAMCPGLAKTEICSSSNESITNEGDSGGPLIWLDHGVRKLVGVNHGFESKKYPNPKYRTVSTSISRELEWINTETQ